MKKILLSVLTFTFVIGSGVTVLEAGQSGYSEPAPVRKRCFLLNKCREVSDYRPPKGVYKICCRRVRKYQVLRTFKMHGGGTRSFTEWVVIYRNHYSDGSTHTWTCVLEGSQRPVGGSGK